MPSKSSFLDYLEKTKPLIDQRIKSIVDNIEEIKIDGYHYYQGKCLRSGLLYLICEALDGDRDKALDLGAAIEIAHGVSLYLDDIIDDDQQRRGKPSLHELKGISVAILKSFSDMSIPFSIAAKYGREYVDLLGQTQRSMASGVMSEIFKTLPATNIYRNIIKQKTGRLFELSGSYGAMCRIKDEEIIGIFSDYALSTGVAMQMADDVGDLKAILTGEKTIDPLTSSELLLLKGVHVDSLAEELVDDLKSHKFVTEKLLAIFNNQKTMEALTKKVYEEVKIAQEKIDSLKIPVMRRAILLAAPLDIAEAKLRGL